MTHRKSDRDRHEQLKTVTIILAFLLLIAFNIADKVELQGLLYKTAEMEKRLDSLQTTMSKVNNCQKMSTIMQSISGR